MILAAIAPTVAAADDALLQALQQARRQCGAAGPALRPQPQLDQAARRLAGGAPLESALQASGYRAQRSFQWTLRGYRSPQAAMQALVPQHCRALADPSLREVGLQRSGNAWWVIAAAPFDPPAAGQSGDVSARVLVLVNRARAQPRRCGSQPFDAAAPVSLNALLVRAAAAHADSMARYGYLAHEGRDGSTPAERVDRTGYRWRKVGENVASGQTSAEQVVHGWLASPEHCANIMEPRFTEMGVAFAVNTASDGGIYWAQVFALPR
ncbi:CAP domain-containing protein [Ramlibacter tataouinensis]|uniref:CAP domain-containing protein n=1 Tax=Ramlibacter tataouinensis TaxID=94132 RepID=UPI0022F3B0C2|nr:CAP domain-containing protein [Ramlibacter tataouinensis]WBY00787.1 CAP domain-containing protein [Ramlibacter tataouinensis]